MKKHFFYFLLTVFVFNFLFLNKFTLALSIGGGIGGNILNFILEVVRRLVQFFLRGLILILVLIINIITITIWAILVLPLIVASWIIDFVSNLNPFDRNNTTTTPAEALWNALRTWGYIILTFAGLYAGFQWLFGEDNRAKRLIFNILLVALLINFTFLFVREAFNIVWQIERGVSGGSIGRIFRDAAATTSPWSLANAIRAGGLPRNEGVNLRGNFISELVGIFMGYITDTIRWILSGDESSGPLTGAESSGLLTRFIAMIFASLLSIVFAFIILLITVIALALYVARYFVITFLAGISSIAVASIAFPEIRIGGKVFRLNFFDQWFSYFVRWVLVIPVFLILFLASLNVFFQFLSAGGINAGSFSNLAQTVFGLIIIVGSFLLSIIFAEELTGKAAGLAKGFALGLSAYLGGLAVGKALEGSGYKVADILEKTGEKIAESRLPMALRVRGIQLQKKAQELREDFYKESLANRQMAVSYHLERFRQNVPVQQKKEALQRALQLIEGVQVGWMKEELIRGFNLSDEDFKTILTDNNYSDEARKILSLMGGSKAPKEAREKLAKIFKGMPTNQLILASINQALYEIWDTLHAEVQKNFLEAIEHLKTEDLIKEFAKLRDIDWQNISQLSQLNLNAYEAIRKKFDKASHNAFTGFIEAVVNNDISTLRANIPFYPEIFGHLDKIAGLIGPNNAARLLIEGLRTAPPETTKYFYPIWFSMRSQLQQLQKLQKQQQLQPQQLQQLQQLSYLLSRSQQIIKVFANGLRQKGDWDNLPRQTQIQINALENARKP